jgi:hypothetical protein
MMTVRDLLAGTPWRRRPSGRCEGPRERIEWRQEARMIGDHHFRGAWSEDWIGFTYAGMLARRLPGKTYPPARVL